VAHVPLHVKLKQVLYDTADVWLLRNVLGCTSCNWIVLWTY